jgi:GDP-mannose transporter
MADQNKKNDDFVAKMPESANENNIGDGDKENDSLVGRGPGTDALSAQPSGFMNKIENSGPFSILAYCLSSISMTVVNKYVVSGTSWNLTFFYLAVQVCFSLFPEFKECQLTRCLCSPLSVLLPSQHASNSA